MTGLPLSALMMVQEACASVALSHDEDCVCAACRATRGDESALAEVIEMLTGDDDAAV